jgi:hypothetical protein
MPSQHFLRRKENEENNRLINGQHQHEKQRHHRRRRKYRPSPIKIQHFQEEEVETKQGEIISKEKRNSIDQIENNDKKKINKSPRTTTNSNDNNYKRNNDDTPTKSIHVPFKPLYPRGVMSPKVSRFIRRNHDNNNRTPTSGSILASPPSVRSPMASPGSNFGFAKMETLNSPSLATTSSKLLSIINYKNNQNPLTPSKPTTSLSKNNNNIINNVNDVVLVCDDGEEDDSSLAIVRKNDKEAIDKAQAILIIMNKQKIQKKIDDFLDTLIKISPTRQTLKSERGDFNILREHLQTNRRYVLIGNKKK